jgi:phosphoglycerate dehydrogenase-like enzyme
MKLLAYDLYQDTIFAAEHDIVYLPLDGLLAKSDFVSVHLPLLPETVGLLGERELKLMKPTAYLINTARGGIVDEDSLIKVLRGGRIAGAGLDVFSVEPLDQVVLSPHVAGVTEESWARMAFQSAENIIQVFQEQKPFGLVNQQVFQDKR